MAEIVGAVTTLGRSLFPQMLGGLLPMQVIAYFKVGEGGWVNPGSGKVPRTPDASFTDLDAVLDAGRLPLNKRYPADSTGTFQKAFVGGDLTFVGPSTLRCRCFLDFGEFNDDGFGNDPEIWEIGAFDAAGNMIGYGTFPLQLKDITKQLENFLRFVF